MVEPGRFQSATGQLVEFDLYSFPPASDRDSITRSTSISAYADPSAAPAAAAAAAAAPDIAGVVAVGAPPGGKTGLGVTTATAASPPPAAVAFVVPPPAAYLWMAFDPAPPPRLPAASHAGNMPVL
jgi:hypothetical protein